MNLWARTRERVFNIYADRDHLTQQRAYFMDLYSAFSFSTFSSLLIILAVVAPENFKAVVKIAPFGLFSLLLSIVLLLNGSRQGHSQREALDAVGMADEAQKIW